MAVTLIQTEVEARNLAENLMGKRSRPAVVISSIQEFDSSWIPVQQVVEDLTGIADVYWLPNGEVTWAFAKPLPPNTQVFGNAARVYAMDNRWVANPKASRLYLVFSESEGKEIAERLAADAWHDARENGLLAQAKAADVWVEGEVVGIVAGRALVQHPGGMATINPDFVMAGLQASEVATKGQHVAGKLIAESGQLNVSDSVQTPEVALGHYAAGDVVLARVVDVTHKQARLELYPNVRTTIHIAQITGNPLDSANDLMSVDEIVRARVQRVGPKWLLNMTDVDDDDETLLAPSLLPGGPPMWVVREAEFEPAPPVVEIDYAPVDELREAVDEPSTASVVEENTVRAAPPRPVVPSPTMLDPARRGKSPTRVPQPAPPEDSAAGEPATAAPLSSDDQYSLKHMTGVVQRLKADLAAERKKTDVARQEARQAIQRAQELQLKLEREQAETKRLRTQQRSTVQRVKQDARSGKTGEESAFSDAEQQFRHDIYMAWVDKIPAQEKSSNPLPEYSMSDWFLETVQTSAPDIIKKIPEVVVEVLTGLADRSDGRQVHPLLDGTPTSPPRTRNNGQETCMRVAVKRGSPSAPRLHYWKGGDLIELSSVRVHDDMQP